jgi:hypothetical protein
VDSPKLKKTIEHMEEVDRKPCKICVPFDFAREPQHLSDLDEPDESEEEEDDDEEDDEADEEDEEEEEEEEEN